MYHELAPQADATIIVGDETYGVSSCDIRKISPVMGEMLDTNKGMLRLHETEGAEAVLYFLRSVHGIFVQHEDITPCVLVKLALLLERYSVGPNNLPHNLVQFCFTKRTLSLSELTSMDLSRMVTVARVLGVSTIQQLLLNIFKKDDVHWETQPCDTDVHCISLLSNIFSKRNNLCIIVGNLLVQSADAVSLLVNEHTGFAFVKALWDEAIWVLTQRPCPNMMLRSLSDLHIPMGWEIYVQRENALCAINDTCKELEHWLDSELVGTYEPINLTTEGNQLGLNDHILALESPSETFSTFSSDYEDEVFLDEPESNPLERARTI